MTSGQKDLMIDPSVPLFITEGVKKGDALRTHGYCAIALAGVWNWNNKVEDWSRVNLKDRDVYIVFDSDVASKREVQGAIKALKAYLTRQGAAVTIVYLPGNADKKVGIDDYLLANGKDAFDRLTEQAKENPEDHTLENVSPYAETKDGLVWNKPDKSGLTKAVKLANFTANIIEQHREFDGVEEKSSTLLRVLLTDAKSVAVFRPMNSRRWAGSRKMGQRRMALS